MSLVRYTNLALGGLVAWYAVMLQAPPVSAADVVAQPRYDFLYVAGSDCLHGTKVRVSNGKLEAFKDSSARDTCDRPAQLLRYQVRDGKSVPISLAEAKQLAIDSAAFSPDGYKLSPLARSAGFKARKRGRKDTPEYCLIGRDHQVRFKVNISGLVFAGEAAQRFSNAIFLGWVAP